jgi:glutamate/tyrosine decarboxylase-like PLP-dependent enzyme
MSADLHKYGYANRGSSILMLRDRDLSHYQTFSSEGWNAGLYATLNFAGSRAGGPVASAYAVMRYLGYGGYLERVERILAAKQRLWAGIEAIGGLRVWGRPQGGHFSFGSTSLDIFAVADGMEAKGWLFGRALDPAAMLLLLNPFHGEIVDGFLTDLEATVAAVKSGEIESSGSQAIYIV